MSGGRDGLTRRCHNEKKSDVPDEEMDGAIDASRMMER